MAINTMGFEDASLLLSALYSQVAGVSAATPTDTSSFVSMAQATLQAGYEPVMNAITQVLSKTLIAVRPYNRKFKGLELTRERWGGIIRKINFGDGALDIGVPLDHVSDPSYELVDDTSVDQWTVKKPAVLETRYVGQNVYESSYTIFTKQLDVAFSAPEEFAAFMSGLMTHFSNQREQYLEMLSRSILDNMIGAKKILHDASVPGPHLIDLLAEYNTATGQSLTSTTVKLPANYPAFCKWAYAYIQHVSDMFTERSIMFERPLDSFPILRHTPKADQRMFLDADFLAHMTAEVLADTYHDNFLRYTEVEAVNYWQSALEPSTVKVKPVYLNGDAEFVNATDPVTVEGIIGVLMDRDAAGYNLADDSLITSPFNAKGQYYNLFNHVRIQLQNDLTEKAVVFCIGEGGSSGDSMKHVKVSLTIDGYGGLAVVANEDGSYSSFFETENGFTPMYGVESAGTTNADLVLFNDVPATISPAGNYVSSSGDCEWDAEAETLTVTGDCAVTVESTD